jgi:glycosyltransferase involved in cell wall biosynthesis
MAKIRVLHILPKICSGGGTRSPLNVVSNSNNNRDFNHIFVSLEKGTDCILNKFISNGFKVIDKPSQKRLFKEIGLSDIVQIEWWNSPITTNFLSQKLPPNRLLIWSHVTGNVAPHIITKELVKFADHFCVCTPHSMEDSWIKAQDNVSLIHSPADFDRLKGFQKKKYKRFIIGYIGTIDYSKLPKNFISLCDKISIPNAHFIVCGNGRSFADIKKIASASTHTFEFPGYVEHIRDYLEQMDVYGYPLNKNTFAAAEQNLQEAMWVGLPIVTNPYGGVRQLIEHNETGLLVDSEKEYIDAIEYLYEHPEERERLGNNAAAHARTQFIPVISADKFENLYERMLQSPKSEKEPIYRINTNHNSVGTKLLIQSLGDSAKALSFSMESQNPCDALNADKEIAKSDDLFHQGCIIQFLHAFPTDPWLNFWNGLIEFERKNIGYAYDSWSLAVRYDINCERIFYYLGLVADCETDEEIRSKLLKIRHDFGSKISTDHECTSTTWTKLKPNSEFRISSECKNDLTRILKSKLRIISPELTLPEQIQDALEKAVNRPIFLWGAGVTGRKVKATMDSLSLLPQGFIDQAQEIDYNEIELPVTGPEILETVRSAFVLICTMQYREVSKSLEQLGLKPIEDFIALHVS